MVLTGSPITFFTGAGEHCINNRREKVGEMNVEQFIREYGWRMECASRQGKVMSVNIGFINNAGRKDETQMDINAYDEQELSMLFGEFCKENRFSADTVDYVVVVKMTDSMDNLLYG